MSQPISYDVITKTKKNGTESKSLSVKYKNGKTYQFTRYKIKVNSKKYGINTVFRCTKYGSERCKAKVIQVHTNEERNEFGDEFLHFDKHTCGHTERVKLDFHSYNQNKTQKNEEKVPKKKAMKRKMQPPQQHYQDLRPKFRDIDMYEYPPNNQIHRFHPNLNVHPSQIQQPTLLPGAPGPGEHPVLNQVNHMELYSDMQFYPYPLFYPYPVNSVQNFNYPNPNNIIQPVQKKREEIIPLLIFPAKGSSHGFEYVDFFLKIEENNEIYKKIIQKSQNFKFEVFFGENKAKLILFRRIQNYKSELFMKTKFSDWNFVQKTCNIVCLLQVPPSKKIGLVDISIRAEIEEKNGKRTISCELKNGFYYHNTKRPIEASEVHKCNHDDINTMYILPKLPDDKKIGFKKEFYQIFGGDDQIDNENPKENLTTLSISPTTSQEPLPQELYDIDFDSLVENSKGDQDL